jgi:hypothetical protein
MAIRKEMITFILVTFQVNMLYKRVDATIYACNSWGMPLNVSLDASFDDTYLGVERNTGDCRGS